MIQFSQSFLRNLSVYLALSCFGLLVFCNYILAEDKFEKQVSITANKQPLSFVLNQISQLTGYTFKYDQNWSNLSVTVNAKNIPIDKFLRKILANYNSAIQYQENGHISINIYEKSDSSPNYVQAPIERPEIENMYKIPRAIDAEDVSDTSESAEDTDTTELESPEESDETQEFDEEEDEKPIPEDKQEDQENIESNQQEKETDKSEESDPDTADNLNSENE